MSAKAGSMGLEFSFAKLARVGGGTAGVSGAIELLGMTLIDYRWFELRFLAGMDGNRDASSQAAAHVVPHHLLP